MKKNLKLALFFLIGFAFVFGCIHFLGIDNKPNITPAPVKVEQPKPTEEENKMVVVKTTADDTTRTDSTPQVKKVAEPVNEVDTTSKAKKLLNTVWDGLAQGKNYLKNQLEGSQRGWQTAENINNVDDIRKWRIANASQVWEQINPMKAMPNTWDDHYAMISGDAGKLLRNDTSSHRKFFLHIPDSMYFVSLISYDQQGANLRFHSFDLYSYEENSRGKYEMIKLAERLRVNSFAGPQFLSNTPAVTAWKSGSLFAKLTPLSKDITAIYPYEKNLPYIITATTTK